MMFYLCFEIFGTCAFSWLHDSIFAHVAKQKLPSNPHLLVVFAMFLQEVNLLERWADSMSWATQVNPENGKVDGKRRRFRNLEVGE